MDSIKKNDIKLIKEHAIDVAKSVLTWVIVTGLAFIYWMVVLLLFSLILLNVWHVKYATVLTVITSLAYIARKIYKLKK